MTMIPEQIMDAIHFARFVMAKEKKDRLGSTADTVYAVKLFLFHGAHEIAGLGRVVDCTGVWSAD
jgi:hypothetical protein